MPDDIETLALIDRILLMAKVEQALSESKQEKGEDWEEVKREMDSW